MKTTLFIQTKNGELHPVEDIQVRFQNKTELNSTAPHTTSEVDQKEHFNVERIAKFLGMKPSGIYGLVHKRKIPHIKKGKRLYFFKSEIMEWLREGSIDTENDIRSKADEYLRKNQI